MLCVLRLCPLPTPHDPSSSMRYFSKRSFPFRYPFPLSSHCFQVYLHFFHFFAVSRAPLCCIVLCFYSAVGACSGLLVGAIPRPGSIYHDLLVINSNHDHFVLPINACSFRCCLYLPVVSPCFPSPAKGFALKPPNTYYSPYPCYFIVKST